LPFFPFRLRFLSIFENGLLTEEEGNGLSGAWTPYLAPGRAFSSFCLRFRPVFVNGFSFFPFRLRFLSIFENGLLPEEGETTFREHGHPI